jgi:hypothetical protein
MNFKLSLPLAGACALLLSGCLNEPIAQRDPGFGEALKYDQALQTINPDPVYPEGAAQPGDNGEHGAEAVKRYREGNVKEVETMGTASGATGSGSGGGGSGPQ